MEKIDKSVHKIYKMIRDEYISMDKSVFVEYALKDLLSDDKISRRDYSATLYHFKTNLSEIPLKFGFLINKFLMFLFMCEHRNDENINLEIIDRLIYITKPMEESEKSIHEIYKMVKSEYDNPKLISHGYTGICSTARKIYSSDLITFIELKKFEAHLAINKPTMKLHKRFFCHQTYIGGAWWWENYSDLSKEQRSKFLSKMILITKPKKK